MRLTKTCVALMVVCLSSGRGFSDEGEEQAEAASLISGYVANLEAINSFDVLIDSQSQWVGENGAIEDYASKERLIVQRDTKRCCSIRNLTKTRYISSSEGATEKREVILLAAICDGEKAWGRAFPKPVFPIKNIDTENVLRSNDSTVVHTVGIVPFPSSYGEIKSLRTHIDYLCYGKVKLQLANGLKGNPAIRIFMPYTDEAVSERVISFDEDNLTPVSMSQTYSFRGSKRVTVRESYECIEKNGIYVVKTLSGERRKSRLVDDVKVPGMVTYDVTFHWLAINATIDDEVITLAIVKDANNALKMISKDVVKKSKNE